MKRYSINWKKVATIAACLIVAASLTSCDPIYDYSFQVANGTGAPIRIEKSHKTYKDRDSTFTIAPREKAEIEKTTVCGGYFCEAPRWSEWETPEIPELIIPPDCVLTIHVGETILPESAQFRKYWVYSEKKRHGVLLLNITNELVSTLNNQ